MTGRGATQAGSVPESGLCSASLSSETRWDSFWDFCSQRWLHPEVQGQCRPAAAAPLVLLNFQIHGLIYMYHHSSFHTVIASPVSEYMYYL